MWSVCTLHVFRRSSVSQRINRLLSRWRCSLFQPGRKERPSLSLYLAPIRHTIPFESRSVRSSFLARRMLSQDSFKNRLGGGEQHQHHQYGGDISSPSSRRRPSSSSSSAAPSNSAQEPQQQPRPRPPSTATPKTVGSAYVRRPTLSSQHHEGAAGPRGVGTAGAPLPRVMTAGVGAAGSFLAKARARQNGRKKRGGRAKKERERKSNRELRE